jgi:uncharacterized protein with PIN domain
VSVKPSPRFVADTMLGRLARWLRILGCDVLYGPNFSGRGLLSAARREGRVVLTRDRRRSRGAHMPPFLLVEGDGFRVQLRQVVDAFGIEPGEALFKRCAECNGELEALPRDAVAGKVPEFVFATQRSFRRCSGCGQLYWDGTHVARIRRELEALGLVPSAALEPQEEAR